MYSTRTQMNKMRREFSNGPFHKAAFLFHCFQIELEVGVLVFGILFSNNFPKTWVFFNVA